MRADLSVIGPQATIDRYVVSGGTAIVAGEPIHCLGTQTNGANGTNTFVLAAADTPVIGTHRLGGVAIKNAVLSGATTATQYLPTAVPIGQAGRIRGRAQTVGSVDTAAELAGIIGDYTLIDYNATGGTDGGELYTIIETVTADTSGLEIVDGNIFKGTLDVVVDDRAFRHDVS
jgi:hypothetical protein